MIDTLTPFLLYLSMITFRLFGWIALIIWVTKKFTCFLKQKCSLMSINLAGTLRLDWNWFGFLFFCTDKNWIYFSKYIKPKPLHSIATQIHQIRIKIFFFTILKYLLMLYCDSDLLHVCIFFSCGYFHLFFGHFVIWMILMRFAKC